MKKLLLIINPMAGKKQSRAPLFDAVSIFSEAGYLVRIHNTTERGDATRTAIAEGPHYDLVVCSGGDGTLNETVSGLMQLEKPPLLGYLPRGSTNDFAASLHLSSNPVKAALAIAENRKQPMDVGQWNDRSFVYVASFGAFTKTSYNVSQSSKNALGHFAYILEGMKDLNTLRPYKVKINADGDVLDGEYLFGAVCNTTSIGGLMKFDSEHVVLNDGKFEMLLIPNPKSPLALQNLLLALMNQHYQDEGIIFRHVSHVIVEPEEELPWSLDGEYAPSLPLVDLSIRESALTMLL
ncbi:MAG: YegS/Rv2252/BmrU family lipid kinase [Oscillibacter sp.]|jgi:YegS/Rv2252/BmrU family lipid kinase|nr:YegS/Rv2252/BmrU family lipid kinase [Oscillibacter sp.]